MISPQTDSGVTDFTNTIRKLLFAASDLAVGEVSTPGVDLDDNSVPYLESGNFSSWPTH